MAEKQPLRYGDIVYFAIRPAWNEEEKVWTASIPTIPAFSFTPKSKVEDPTFALFQLDAYTSDLTDISQRGQTILPEAPLRLYHLQTNCYASFASDEVALELKLDASAASPTGFSVFTRRVGVELAVCDGDEIAIIGQPQGDQFFLAQDFWFKGISSDRFFVHRFEAFLAEDSGGVRYGCVVRVQTGTGLFLSVKPNSDLEATLALQEDEMKEDYHQGGEFCYPEYTGELRADLSSDGEDGNCYWVVERHDKLALGGQMAMHKDRFDGGRVMVGDGFFLRHIASARYLTSDLTLKGRPAASKFSLSSTSDIPDGKVTYGHAGCLMVDEYLCVSINRTPSLPCIKSILFEPVLASLDPTTVLRLPLTTSADYPQTESLKVSFLAVEPKDAYTLLELALYLPRLSEMRVALQHLKKQPDAATVLYGISNRVMLKTLTVINVEHTFLSSIASDFQIVSEMLRIWILTQSMFSDYEKLFTDVNFFVHLTNPMQNIQFYERVSRNIFANRALLHKLTNVAPVVVADILQWTLKARPPKDDERLYWADAYLTMGLNLNTYNDVTSVLFFCHFLLDRLPVKMQLTNKDFIMNNGNFIFRVEKRDGDYYGYTYGASSLFTSVIRDTLGFTATSLELYADLCTHTDLRSDIVAGSGLDLQTCYDLYLVSTEAIRAQMAILYFISEVHIPNSCEMPALSEIANRKLLSRASLSGVLDTSEACEWCYFPEHSSPIAKLIAEEVEFWLDRSHLPLSCDDPTTWYYNTVVHFRFLSQLIENCPVSDMFVASMVSAAIAFTFTALGVDSEGFTERFPKLSDSNYRTETEKQRTVEEMLGLLVVYQRWKLVKVIRKSYRGGVVDNLTKEVIQRYIDEISFQQIYTEFSSRNRVGYTCESYGSANIPRLSENFSKLLSNPNITVMSILDYFATKTTYTCRGNHSLLSEMILSEANGADAIMKHLSEIVAVEPYAEVLPFLTEIQSVIVSVKDLALSSAENVLNLVPYITALEKLCDFMLELQTDSGNFDRFQAFLCKGDFVTELKRAWSYCAHISEDNSEDSLYVQLRTITIEASRLYVLGNEGHKKQLLAILPIDAFYPDYPQYIHLITELGLMEECQKIVSGLNRVLFEKALGGDRKRYALVWKQFLNNKRLRSKVLFTIVDHFKTIAKEQLNNYEWELLIAAGLAITPSERKQWLSDIVEKWYNASPDNIRREGAALVVFSDQPESPFFANALSNTSDHIAQINTRSVEQITSNFDPLVDIPKSVRSRNFEAMDSDIEYLLELYFEPKSGVIYQLLTWKNAPKLPNVAGEFATLYLKIIQQEKLKQFTSELYPALMQYSDEVGNSIPGEISAIFDLVREAPSRREPVIPNNPVIPAITPVYGVRF